MCSGYLLVFFDRICYNNIYHGLIIVYLAILVKPCTAIDCGRKYEFSLCYFMKIAIFSDTIDTRNGYGNITKEYCRSLKKKNIDFVLFLPASGKDRCNGSQYPFKIDFSLPDYIFRIKLINFWSYFFPKIDLSSFDIVHSLFDFPYCFLAARLAKKFAKPYIMGAQGTYGVLPLTYFPEKYMLKWSYRQARKIVVPSQFTKEKIIEFSKENYPIEVIHNGVNFNRFSKANINNDILQKYVGKKILLTVGGLKNRKGQDLVMRALPEIVLRFPNILYLMVGVGSTRDALQNLARSLKVDNHIEFLGNKEGNELVNYFHICDAYIHTPRVTNLNFEGFGIVYLEASACKKPIVATDSGGIRNAVKDGQTGLIVPDGSIKEIANAVIKLFLDANLSRKLGENGCEYAKLHDWSNIINHFIRLYRSYAKK